MVSSNPPPAARHLEITPSTLGDRAGSSGAAVLAIEHVLRPSFVDEHWVGQGAGRSAA